MIAKRHFLILLISPVALSPLLAQKVGVNISNPGYDLHVNGPVKVGNGFDQSARDTNMLYIGDGAYIQIGEWEADDLLSLKANRYNFTVGHVGINQPNPSSPIDINNYVAPRSLNIINNSSYPATVYGIYNQNNLSGNGAHYGIWTELGGPATGPQYGSFHKLLVDGDGTQTGTYNDILSTGSGEHQGSVNVLSGSGFGNHYGTKNILTGVGSGTQYGSYQEMVNSGDGNKYGIFNSMISLGAQYGVWNEMAGQPGIVTGVYNHLVNQYHDIQYGTYNLFEGNGEGTHYATYSLLTGGGSGNQYGSRHDITNSGHGTHYGVSNSLEGNGNGGQIGTYNIISNTGAGFHHGVYNKLQSGGSNLKYGIRQEVAGTSIADIYGIHNTIDQDGVGTAEAYGIYQTVHTNSNICEEIFGTYNYVSRIADSVTLTKTYGTFNKVEPTGSYFTDVHIAYGTYNTVHGENIKFKYGTYNSISDSTIFSHLIGTANALEANESSIDLFGTHTRIECDTCSEAFGTYNVIERGPRFSYGVYGSVFGAGEFAQVGVKGSTGTDTTLAGSFNGDVFISGDILNTSDMRVKQNIRPANFDREIFETLNIYNYEYDDIEGWTLPHSIQTGMLAQELEQVYPHLVKMKKETIFVTEDNGDVESGQPVKFKTVNYVGLVPILVQATQEALNENEMLKQRLDAQQRQIHLLTAQMQTLLQDRSQTHVTD